MEEKGCEIVGETGESHIDRPVWGRYLRREVQVALDLFVLVIAFFAAYLLRFDFEIPAVYVRNAAMQVPFVVALQLAVLWLVGVYNFVWRYIGLGELKAFLKAMLFCGIPMLILRLNLPQQFEIWRIPRSVILLDLMFAFGGVLTLRILRRTLYERHERTQREMTSTEIIRKPVLLVGAGRAGILAAKEIRGRGDLQLDIAGFIDDAPEKKGTVIAGLKVLGVTDELPQLVEKHAIDHVVITIADADASTMRRIVETCDRAGVRARIIPGYYEILQGNVSISRFRDVQIEDLLGREPVRLDEKAIRSLLTGKSVMLTGAGGSIGAELARQIARFNPLRLILVERAEGALFEIAREIMQLWPQLPLESVVADVGDERRIRSVLNRMQPHAVFHAAAHKHVPLMETNAGEAVKNNVLGTELLARLSGECGIEVFVLISTDKAVCPSSIMGATKRVAELVIQDLDKKFAGTRFLAVRFGNVLGSAGSVVPIFREQIRAGGPVTVTHPDVTRYFMTIPEASQLVLQAGAIGNGGEILILDMGQPVKILDLAKDMISLSGYKPYDEIDIQFTGLRPGEKLIEELQLTDEEIGEQVHPKIYVGKLRAHSAEEISGLIAQLRRATSAEDTPQIRAILSDFLPEALLDRRRHVPQPTDAP